MHYFVYKNHNFSSKIKCIFNTHFFIKKKKNLGLTKKPYVSVFQDKVRGRMDAALTRTNLYHTYVVGTS